MRGNTLSQKLFTSTERKAVEALAKDMSYSSLRAYLRWLVEMDAKAHGKPNPLNDDQLEHPMESFRRAWGEAMRGEGMTYEEFERRMKEDQ